MNKAKGKDKKTEIKKLWIFHFTTLKEHEEMNAAAKSVNMTLAGFFRHLYTNWKDKNNFSIDSKKVK